MRSRRRKLGPRGSEVQPRPVVASYSRTAYIYSPLHLPPHRRAQASPVFIGPSRYLPFRRSRVALGQSDPQAGTRTVGLLDRERIVARPGFNRWLVPPAALAIHLSIGMAYGFSVFWLPLSRAIGITEPVACPATGFLEVSTHLRLADQHARLDVHAVLRVPGLVGGGVRRAGSSGPGRARRASWPPSAGAAGS